MIKATDFVANQKRIAKGLYESYYFRGNNSNGNQSFWLKHNFLIFKNDPKVIFESTVVTFDKGTEQKVHCIRKTESISMPVFMDRYINTNCDWNDFKWEFNDGSFVIVNDEYLKGSLTTPGNDVKWDLDLKLSGEAYYHFSNNRFYESSFPKKKILTKDIRVQFNGGIVTDACTMEGDFIGMNGHNWGIEHAYRYAYADCNQFDEDPTAYFDGFSARILLLGFLKSPYLAGCSLKTNGKWYHFNDVLTSFRHKTLQVLEKTWRVTYVNNTHRLDVIIDGENECWAHLKYDHPSGKISTVNNTKFAKGKLILSERHNGKNITELNSSFFELESLIP